MRAGDVSVQPSTLAESRPTRISMSPDPEEPMKPAEPEPADAEKKDNAAKRAEKDAFLPAPVQEEQRKVVEEWQRPPGQSSG